MLKNIKLLFLTAIFVTICYKEVFTTTSYRDRVIGCLFSDVCSPNEACFDDNAFGRCEDYDPVSKKYSSHYVYDLDRKTLQLLEKELDRLSEEGFTWNDSYAQCVLKTVLNDRPRIVYDPTSCNYRRFPEPIVDLLVSDKTHREQPDSDLPSQAKSRQDDNNVFPTFSPSPQQSPSGPSDPLPIAPSLFGKGAKQNQLLSQSSSSARSKLTNELLSESLPSSSPSSTLNSYQTIKAQTQINSNNDKEFSDVNRKPIGGNKQTQLSDDIIKSKLRSEYLKRSPSGQLNTNSDSQFPDELDDNQDLSEAVQNQLLQVLLGNLKNSDSTNQFGSDSSNNEYSEPVQPLPDSYLAYSADSIPYLSNPQPDRKYDQQTEDELLQSYGPQYQPVWFRKTPIASPLVPKAYSSDASNQLEDDDHNNIYIVKGPLPDIFSRPEIRVLRDANPDQYDDITLIKPIDDNQLPLDSDEEVAQLLPLLQSPSDPDVIMVDVIENDGSKDGEYAKLIDNILGQSTQNKANNDDSSMEDELIGGVVNLNTFNQNEDDDDDEDDKINKEMKEMLFGDINYNNNYDTKMPNFYRKHRYDIKKPGPKYYEEYFFKPDNEESSEVEKSNDEPILIENKAMELNSLDDSPIMKKKDNNIRSNKPVSEGPVKVDAKSENTIIIRSAEEGEETSLEAIDSTHTYVVTDRMLGEEDSQKFVQTLEQVFKLPRGTFSNLRKEEFQITFKVNPNYRDLNASQVASRIEDLANVIKDITGYNVKETGIGDKTKLPVVSATIIKKSNEKLINITLLICSVILAIISAAFIIFLFRRNGKFREKVKGFVKISEDWMNFDYQDLCRQRMQGKTKEKEESTKKGNLTGSNESVNKVTNGENLASQQGSQEAPQNSSNRSSTSSWVEEPVSSNMDISTGHIILSYMEDHLKKKDRLDQEWEALCAYEADPCATNAASQKQNANKNRYPDILPYDHSRVILNDLANSSNSDYINANTITDHDPRNPAYIVTQGPLSNTKADFWQMIWEQGSVIIVMLTRLRENGLSMCDRYWPEEGTETYQNYEVNLVSEHIWCEDYLVRSFYLKNLKTSETRTVTQFHFLSWPENGIPPNTKSILDFRRKVNKSYKGRSCPIVVHCSDGIGRTGTYILIDMVLNRLAKGAKEIDIAATLEHIRDQRPGIVKNKAQFEFVLLAVAEEVQAILKALSQNN